jgi:hypothetical protein
MSKKRPLNNSGRQKIDRALACGFRPGNGWYGPGAFLKRTKRTKTVPVTKDPLTP